MKHVVLAVLLVSACGDSSDDADRSPHLVQHGDPDVVVHGLLGRVGANHEVIVAISRPAVSPIADATVRAGAFDAEVELAYDAAKEWYRGELPGDQALIHVTASWSSGDADLVVAPPPPIVLTPDPPRLFSDVTIRWQPWRPDRVPLALVKVGLTNGLPTFETSASDPAATTSVVVPQGDVPAGDAYFEVRFLGSLRPTGGVSTDSPTVEVDYTHHDQRTVQ